jgi:hypothetical protein
MRFGTIDTTYAVDLATREPENDGPIYMVNFMKYKQVASYRDPSASESPISGQEADDKYAPVDVLERIGAHVAFHGSVVAQGCADEWDRMGIVKYPTRRSFIDMQSRPDFKTKYVHKEAGMDYTIVMGTLPAAEHPEIPRRGYVTFRLTAEPHECVVSDSAARLGVEGTIVGDGRTWSTLSIAWSDEIPMVPTLEKGGLEIVVVARAEIDRLGKLLSGR